MADGKTSARGMARPALLITAATVLAQGVQVLFVLVLAKIIPQVDRDIYSLAARVPIIMVQGTLQGALSIVFVPLLIQHLSGDDPEASRQKAREFAGVFLNVLLVGLVVLVLLGELGAPALSHALTTAERISDEGIEWTAHTRAQVAACIRVLWLACALVGLGSLFASVHYAHNRFRHPALAVVLMAVGQLAALLVIRGRAGALGLGWAHVVGGIVYLVTTGASVLSGEHFSFVWRFRHRTVTQALRRFVVVFGGSFLVRGPMFVEARLAAGLSKGAVFNLSTASRFVQAVAQLLQRGPLTSLLPHSARHAASRDDEATRYAFLVTSRMVLMVLAPVVAGLVVLRMGAFRCLLERGQFGIGDSIMVARASVWYAPALIALTLSGIAAYSLYARQKTWFIVPTGLVATLVSLVGAPLLLSAAGYRGLALAFSLSMVAMNAVTYVWLDRHVGGVNWRDYLSSAWRICLAAGVMGAVLLIFRHTAQSAVGWPDGPKGDLAGWHDNLTIAVWLGGFAAMGMVTYVAALAVLRSRELARLWEVALEKWAERRPPRNPGEPGDGPGDAP